MEFDIISHLHIDHIGGALYLEKNHNIPVYISKNDYDTIKNMVDSYTGIFIIQILLGSFSATVYLSDTSVIQKWLPQSSRGISTGIKNRNVEFIENDIIEEPRIPL